MSEHAIAWSLGWRRGDGDPQSGVVLRDCSLQYVCVCVHPFPFPQPCAANEQWFDCWCEMSAVCLSVCDMSFWQECFSSIILPPLVFVKVFSMQQLSSEGTIKKTHRSFPFLMLCCWRAAFGPIILGSIVMMDWIHILIFFKYKNVCGAILLVNYYMYVIYHHTDLPVLWWIAKPKFCLAQYYELSLSIDRIT